MRPFHRQTHPLPCPIRNKSLHPAFPCYARARPPEAGVKKLVHSQKGTASLLISAYEENDGEGLAVAKTVNSDSPIFYLYQGIGHFNAR
jgi:hypothetical protein